MSFWKKKNLAYITKYLKPQKIVLILFSGFSGIVFPNLTVCVVYAFPSKHKVSKAIYIQKILFMKHDRDFICYILFAKAMDKKKNKQFFGIKYNGIKLIGKYLNMCI